MVQKIPLVETDFAYVPLDEKDTLVTRAIPLSPDDENILEARQDGFYIKPHIGAPGKSAYELWLAEGHTGSLDDYIDALKGDPGESAYELWLSEGHTGSFNDYMNALKGQPGNPAKIEISDTPSNLITMRNGELFGFAKVESVDNDSTYGVFSFDYPASTTVAPNNDNACGRIPGTEAIYFRVRQNVKIPKRLRPYNDFVYASAILTSTPSTGNLFQGEPLIYIPHWFNIDSLIMKLDRGSLEDNNNPDLTYYFIASLICYTRPTYCDVNKRINSKGPYRLPLQRGPNSQNTGLPDYPMVTSMEAVHEFEFKYSYHYYYKT